VHAVRRIEVKQSSLLASQNEKMIGLLAEIRDLLKTDMRRR